MFRMLGFTLAATVAVTPPTWANDGVASVVAGGIVLEKTADIRLLSEDLHLSLDQVRVDYVFENKTDHDVAVTLAFPFPEMFADDFDNQWADDEGTGPLVDFQTTFAGKTVKAREVIEIIGLEGETLTELFRREGLPLHPLADMWRPLNYFDDTPDMRRLRDKLIALDLMGNFQSRKWKYRVSYVWDAVFPAGRQVRIHHSYHPKPGAFLPLTEDAYVSDFLRDRYCLPAAEMDQLKAVPPEIRSSRFVRQLDYVLTTGANWAEPIHRFRLSIDKGGVENRVRMCWHGEFRETSPTTLEFTAKNFLPRQDISLIILPSFAPLEE